MRESARSLGLSWAFVAGIDPSRARRSIRAGGRAQTRVKCCWLTRRSRAVCTRGTTLPPHPNAVPATTEETSVPKPNYRQAKKQKELSRKARQLEKQQRRATRSNDSGEVDKPLQDPAAGLADPTLSGT